ncbi:MAG TPA: class I SAM-dependent methyltransferase [Candidatus Saccharimonadales bacterium]|nr:class I SAM-dependent methyltransferase [Candidatus Saccharimonadales bacterium]
MAGYYAARAREYERIYHKPERQADLRKLQDSIEGAFAGRDVLEVACGTGYWTEILGRSAVSVVATDINEEVLAVARVKAMDPRKVAFQREDAYALPILPQQFTGGFSAFWWSHIPEARIGSFIQGFHRAISPGTRVVFIDNIYVEGSSTPISRTDEQRNTYQTRRLDDGSQYEVLKNFPTEAELRAAVDDFAADVQVELLRYYWILSYATR